MQATRLRSTVARIQAALLRKMTPDLEGVLIAELAEQLEASKDIRAKLAARLEVNWVALPRNLRVAYLLI